MPQCPACAEFARDPATRRHVHVITADGLSHAVPAAWLAGRRHEFERDGVAPVDAIRAAYLEWAATCALAGGV
jgi:hypothetical protein